MNRLQRTWLAAALAVLAGATAAVAGDAPDEFQEELVVSEVLLDVLVTDKQGNVIVGLGPDDFVVEEDGKEVPLTGVTFYSNRQFLEGAAAAQAKNVDLERVPEDRYFILLFHDPPGAAAEISSYVSQRTQAYRDARRWAEGKLPTDHVAVARYGSKLEIHSDFTTDPVLLVQAIDSAARGKDPGNNWPSRIDAQAAPLLANLPRGKELGRETTRIYDALTLLADAAGDIVGRKNLIYIGLGFGTLDSVGQFLPDTRYYPETERALNDNNVAVYTVDLLGPGSDHQLENSLSKVASDTGGRFFGNFTSFTTPLQEIAEETNGYYLLSYEARHPAEEKGFQEVDVRTKNPEFRVRARTGYVRGND